MDYIYNVRLIFMMSLRIGGHVSSTYVEWYSIYSGRVENMIGGSRGFLSWECLPLFFISSSSSYTTSFYVTRILFLLLPFRNGHWTATNMLLFFVMIQENTRDGVGIWEYVPWVLAPLSCFPGFFYLNMAANSVSEVRWLLRAERTWWTRRCDEHE